MASPKYALLGNYPLDTLQVGAVAVNTTAKIISDESTSTDMRSVMAEWDHDTMGRFHDLLVAPVHDVVDTF